MSTLTSLENTTDEIAKAFSEKRFAIILVDPEFLIASYSRIASSPPAVIAVPSGGRLPPDSRFVS